MFMIAVVGIAAYGINGALLYGKAEPIKELQAFPAAESRPGAIPRPGEADLDPINILLMGVDGNSGSAGELDELTGLRSDMMILVNIPADRDSVNLMSIMRDNWVPVPGYGTTKINAAHAHGGPQLAVHTVEDILGIPVDHVAIVDFDGLVGATDAIGGVTVPNDESFSCGADTVPVGDVPLNGEQSLCYLRNRNYADGDYTRVLNQQKFLIALVEQLATPEILANPIATRQAIGPLTNHLILDDGLDMFTLTSLALSLRDITAIHTYTFPTLGTGYEGSQSVVYPDWDEVVYVSESLRADTFDEFVVDFY